MADKSRKPRKVKVAKVTHMRNLETGKSAVLTSKTTTGKDGKPVITYTKSKPGNSNN